MKAITISIKQKIKLLEMANILFPEHSPFQIGSLQETRKGFGYSQNFIFSKTGTWDINGIAIHWFEFCMTYLPIALFHKMNEAGGNNLWIVTNNLLRFEDFGRYDINPIDYLYNQFKKLGKSWDNKSATSMCGSEGCDSYKWDHICRCK